MAEEAEDQIDMDSALGQISESLFAQQSPEEESELDLEETQDVDSVEDSEETDSEDDSEDDSEVDSETESETEDEPEEAEVELVAMPNSWKKDMGEQWKEIPKEVQEYIVERDKQSIEGLDKDRDAANLGRELRGIVSPYAKLLNDQGVDEKQAVQFMLEAHKKLSTGDEVSRKAAFANLAKAYRLSESDANPDMEQVLAEISQLKQTIADTRSITEGMSRKEVTEKVEAFAREHEHFDALSDDIARFIGAGYELDEAYKVAYRASDFFDADLQKQGQQKEQKTKEAKKKETAKAKKASSVNVRGRDTKKAPTAPKGTMQDTMRETMRDIKSRSSSRI